MPDLIASALARFDLFLIDLWGVVWLGGECRPIERSADFIRRVQASGKQYHFLSNTVWPETELQARFKAMGVDVPLERFITAGRVVSDRMDRYVPDWRTKRFIHVGRPWEPPAYFSRFNLVDDPAAAEVLIVGDYGGRPGEDPAPRNSRIEQVLAGGRTVTAMVCNPDRSNLQTDGSRRPQAGQFMLDFAVKYPQHTYHFIGKPHKPIYDYALERAPGVPRDRIAMVGDTVETDMHGADAAGIGKILVLVGNTSTPPPGLNADFVIEKY
jgi:glycerol-1-phosphatase